MTVSEQIVQFNRLFIAYDELFRSAARRFDLPELSLWILYALREIPDCTQANLKSVLLHSKQSIQSALRRLEQEGLVDLMPDPRDRRSKIILLTQKGKSISTQTSDRIVAAEKRGFEKLSPGERTQFLDLFGRLCDAVRHEMKDL